MSFTGNPEILLMLKTQTAALPTVVLHQPEAENMYTKKTSMQEQRGSSEHTSKLLAVAVRQRKDQQSSYYLYYMPEGVEQVAKKCDSMCVTAPIVDEVHPA
jgi:hypothetical protein